MLKKIMEDSSPLLEKIKAAASAVDSYPETSPDDTCSTCLGFSFVRTVEGRVRCPTCYTKFVTADVEHNLGGEFEEWGITFRDIIDFPNYTFTPSLAACQDMLESILNKEKPRAVVLSGNYGRGKTCSSIALIKELARKQFWGYGLRFPTLINHVKRGMDGAPFELSNYRNIQCSSLVFVDEIGKETSKGNVNIVQEEFRKIVDLCYRKRNLIIATNLDRRSFRDFIGGHCADRLKPTGDYCTIIEDSGDSLR